MNKEALAHMRRVGRTERNKLVEIHVTPGGKSQGQSIRGSAPVTAIRPMGDSAPHGTCHGAAFTSPGHKWK